MYAFILPQSFQRLLSCTRHKHRVLNRDLKPENMLLNAKGYCIVIDLDLSKVIDGPKYTFCGTSEFMAPALILGTGYSLAVDYWALGILLYKLYSGVTPFVSLDGCPTGNAINILRGQLTYLSHFSPLIQLLI